MPKHTHHQQVIEEKNFPLVSCLLLHFVHVGNFIQTAAADQPAMGHGQDLQKIHKSMWALWEVPGRISTTLSPHKPVQSQRNKPVLPGLPTQSSHDHSSPPLILPAQ